MAKQFGSGLKRIGKFRTIPASIVVVAFLALAVSAFWVAVPSVVFSQELRTAPLNPEFVEWLRRKDDLEARAHLTPEGYGLGLVPSPVDLSHLVYDTAEQRFLRTFPSRYDLRTLGRLTPVKNQNPYGTCWSFGTYGSFESCLLSSKGESHDFAENHLINLHGFDWGYDDGGNAKMSTAYLARWTGPVHESSDPYPNPGGSPEGLAPVKHVYSVEIIPRRTSATDNAAIKQAVMSHGALSSSMYWVSDAYHSPTYAYYRASEHTTNHCVVIVGWDDNFSRTNFANPPPGNGAFIIRNSWGTTWGEGGYFYISYYDGSFARNSEIYVFLNAESTDLHSQIYQYDTLGWTRNTGYGSDTAWAANMFMATHSSLLSAVSFYACAVNTSYQVMVYSDVTAGQPRSGVLRAEQTGSFLNAGYYTVNLPVPFAVNTGSRFSVVVKLTTPNYDYPIPLEVAIPGYSSKATVSPGQSFISIDGEFWSDAATTSNGNVCIKAFMATAPPMLLYVSKDGHCGGLKPCYATIQGAVNAAGNGALIKVGQGFFPEGPSKATFGEVTISGSWVSNFSQQAPGTTQMYAPQVGGGASITVLEMDLLPLD